MAEKQNIPEIRFEGFTDPWEQRKFSEIVDVCSGRDYKHLNEGPIPVYGTGGYMTSVCEALSHNRDAVGIGRKGTIDKPYLLKAPFWTVDTLFYAIPKPDINLEFALCSFLNVDWKSKDESTGLPSLSKEAINETVLRVPNAVEQNHLGSFFTDIDSLITLHQRKCQYRSLYGYLSWEQRKLNEYLETSREKNESCHFGKDDVLSVSGDYGIVNQIEFQGRSYAGTSVANYGVVHKGDVVYTKSPLRINPYGIIKTNRGNDGIVSTLYAVYHPTEKTHPDFVQVYFEQNARMNNYMAPLVSKGAKNDMKVSAENALKGAVTFPGIKEQEVIASYFSQLDDLIALHQ